MTLGMTETLTHDIVDHDTWVAARVGLLEREKAFTRARDELSAARRDLPWERVEKPKSPTDSNMLRGSARFRSCSRGGAS